MLFESGKLNQIPFFPVSWHTPRYFLHCVRQCGFHRTVNLPQIRLSLLWLTFYVFFYGCRNRTAIVSLIRLSECASALWTFPLLGQKQDMHLPSAVCYNLRLHMINFTNKVPVKHFLRGPLSYNFSGLHHIKPIAECRGNIQVMDR